MKTRILLCGLALFAAQAAHAQSNDEKAFDGFKIGASLGRTSNDIDRPVAGETAKLDLAKKSFDWRGYVGYDVQTDSNIVIGAELGLGGGGKTFTQKVGATNVKVNPGRTIDATGRLGYAVGNSVLIFGKAGWAWQRFDLTATPTAAGAKAVDTKIKESGFLYGAGVEFALSPSISIRGEYES
ncbi:MAG: outer membrane beta-barrel protein [Sphingopyxis sp.]|uniref:outer membrane protein n=1 Tax=Sphingopyxis sp. TaxID=1908224 RepID=UPI002ABCEDB9|nr:outer membrane beta-barrel protein [Sphingopyxis sp.]MDZ3832221.1 outer membrane beta-barrel protein [Sphingopyxis sp.]